MSTLQPESKRQLAEKTPFPWSHIVGYLLSLVLTVAAFELVFNHVAKFGVLLLVILILAALQILVQLLFFMHVTERHGPYYHMMMFGVALFFVFVFIAASIWIMTFNTPVS